MSVPYAPMPPGMLNRVSAASGFTGTLSQPKWQSPCLEQIFYALMGYSWMSRTYISEFTMDKPNVAGKTNAVADCLSHAITSAVHLRLDYARMAVDQATDPGVQVLRTATTGLQLSEVTFGDGRITSATSPQDSHGLLFLHHGGVASVTLHMGSPTQVGNRPNG